MITKFYVVAFYLFVLLEIGKCGGQVSSIPNTNDRQADSDCSRPSGDIIKTYSVDAGSGVGEIQLGGTVERTLSMMKGKCLETTVVYHPNNKYFDASISARDEMTNNFTKGAGIRCYFVNDNLFQVSVDSYFYSHEEVTKNSLLQDVMKKYADGQAFHLGPSNQNLNSIKRLSYWVVKGRGIAFEFYETAEKQRRISNIYIFQPNSDFFPLGTPDAPEFVKLVKD